RVVDLTRLDRGVACVDGQYPAARHRVAGVRGQVDEHLLERSALGAYRPHVRLGGDTQLDVLAEGTAEQLGDVVQQVVHGHRLRAPAAPTEREELVGEGTAARGG